jgi:hypothetical protein
MIDQPAYRVAPTTKARAAATDMAVMGRSRITFLMSARNPADFCVQSLPVLVRAGIAVWVAETGSDAGKLSSSP